MDGAFLLAALLLNFQSFVTQLSGHTFHSRARNKLLIALYDAYFTSLEDMSITLRIGDIITTIEA
jgi:hypothetical protein